MLVMISPAVNMKPVTKPGYTVTKPLFLGQAHELAGRLRQYDPWQLESLLQTNDKLALQAHAAFQAFDPNREGSPAILSFHGLAYQNLSPADFTADDLLFASTRLRILSAMYGMLKPSDGIQPYRLDFNCRFSRQFEEGRNLYDYWGPKVRNELFRHGKPVINLCSGEYTKLVKPHLQPQDHMVTCRFLVTKSGKLCCQATASKMARGQMARHIILNRLDGPGSIKQFDWDGFQYVESRSTGEMYVFVKTA